MTSKELIARSNRRRYKKILLLGLDGLDPKILSGLMQNGELPNFSRLRETGSYAPLATSIPAQSPVAWASLATGNDPGYHGIFDFLSRRVSDYMPELAITRQNPKNPFGKREAMFLPVMHGNAFWDYTSENGIPSVILKWPMTFQPKQNKAMLYAGLGVPDIKGGLGKYTFYTTRQVPKDAEGSEKVVQVSVNGGKIRTAVSGPNIVKLMSRESAKAELQIAIISDSEIEMTVDGARIRLHAGSWSEWTAVKFKLGMMKTASGIVKFYLNQIAPEFDLYMTPVQINPKDPAFVISSPDSYIKKLAAEMGHFYTLGMPEDTKALEEGRIHEEAFIAMCNEIIDEQEQMLWNEFKRFQEGMLAATFFSTDRLQHIFWVTRDPEHPLYDEEYAKKYGHVIDDVYRTMDRVLGDLLTRMDNETAIIVFSDHGFTTFRRTVHINSWLAQNGFIRLTQTVDRNDRDGGGLFQYVDWKNTKAYSLGFGSIYLNLKGRERQGIVDQGDADAIANKIIDGLMQFKDDAHGKPIVKKVYRRNEIYSGNQTANAPDLVIGFHDGYRASWQTAIGGTPNVLVEDNLKKWSGDHIVDPSIVPGILLTNFQINTETPNLMDIAPTVLSFFGMSEAGMKGKSLLKE